MSTITLRDALDDLEQRLSGAGAPASGEARPGVRLHAEEEEEDDLFGEDELGFDSIDEDEADEDDLEELDPDLDDDELDEDLDDEL